GGPMLTGRHITGTITGGTGRWNGVTGEYEFTWQYVVSGDGASIQGRSVDLRGRLRWREGGRGRRPPGPRPRRSPPTPIDGAAWPGHPAARARRGCASARRPARQ